MFHQLIPRMFYSRVRLFPQQHRPPPSRSFCQQSLSSATPGGNGPISSDGSVKGDITIRLSTHIKSKGVGSKNQAIDYISKGCIKVNGEIVLVPGTRIDPSKDIIDIDNAKINLMRENYTTYALYKPIGVLCRPENTGEPYVCELVPPDPIVHPIGRLDKDSSGLIILSNDGVLTDLLINPDMDRQKEYFVQVLGNITDDTLRRAEEGISVLGKKTKMCTIKRCASNSFFIILTEGRNRQIRRMCRSVGYEVVVLHRLRIGNFILQKNIREGQFKKLSLEEISLLTCGKYNYGNL